MLDPNASTLIRSQHIMRSAWSATLLFDQSPFETKCMIDPRTGDFIVAVLKDALDGDDLVLACPRDSLDTQIRISIELSDSVTEEQTDRFTAYHLPSTTPLLAIGKLEYAKLDSGEVVTHEDCSLANPLVDSMGQLCRVLNANRGDLAGVCKFLSGVDHESPLAVGVDPTGIDIRASFGLVRLVFPIPVHDADEAMNSIEALLESCNA